MRDEENHALLRSRDAVVPIPMMTVIVSLASCVLILKAYDYLRLFEATSFYVQLI